MRERGVGKSYHFFQDLIWSLNWSVKESSWILQKTLGWFLYFAQSLPIFYSVVKKHLPKKI